MGTKELGRKEQEVAPGVHGYLQTRIGARAKGDTARAGLATPVLLPLFALIFLAGCSARIETEAIDGHIEDYRHADGLQRSIRISWRCGTKSIVSSLFSPSGETGCNEEEGRGEVELPINPDGTFEIPAFDVKVTKFFSSPSLFFRWELVTVNENGEEDTRLLTGSRVYDNRFFEDVLAEYSSLRHISIEDACVVANITARDGSERFPFDDIKRVYPDSRNFTQVYYLGATLRRDDQVVASTYLGMDYDQARFCGTNLGLFVPKGEQNVTEELSFSARVEIAAGVVYSISPPDPVTGQKSRDYRHVREVITRKAEAPVGLKNRIPAELLAPITIELDITRAATN